MIDPVQAAVGIVVLLVAVGALLYIFYSRTNAVEKTGYGALLMLSIVSLMIPVFWIMESNQETTSKVNLFTTNVQRGAALYAQYCFQCHGLNGQGGQGSQLNGNTAVNGLSDNDLMRIISAGVYDPANPKTPLMPAWSDQYGGPLTQEQITYLFDLIRSADPTYLSQNGYPNSNGFSQVPDILRLTQPNAYATAAAQANGSISQFPVVDMTKQKAVMIDIITAPSGATCQPACFAIADPKNPGKMIISPNIKVKVGTTITWVNMDTKNPHTATEIMGENPGITQPATNGFDTGVLSTNQKYSYKVTMNDYNLNKDHGVVYYCKIHPVMTAALTITLT